MEKGENICRICFDGGLENELISVCNCTGSVKYVHQNCIRAWILSQFSYLESANCELCTTKFRLHYTMGNKCSCEFASEHDYTKYVPVLVSIIVLLGLSSYLLIISATDAQAEDHKLYLSLIASLLLLTGLILFSITCICVKQIFTTKYVKHWTVLPFDNEAETTQNVQLSFQIEEIEIPRMNRFAISPENTINTHNPNQRDFEREERRSFSSRYRINIENID